jgi:hypothetical protein
MDGLYAYLSAERLCFAICTLNPSNPSLLADQQLEFPVGTLSSVRRGLLLQVVAGGDWQLLLLLLVVLGACTRWWERRAVLVSRAIVESLSFPLPDLYQCEFQILRRLA